MPCTERQLRNARRYRERHRERFNRRARERTAAGLSHQPTSAQKRASELRNAEGKRAYQRELYRRREADPAYREQRRAEARARYAATTATREAAKDAAAARRARKRSVFVERVFRSVVWQRDEGVCGICGLAADPVDWHLDHVIALARGGEHSYANTQVSHPFCNLSKGAQ